MLTRLGYQYRCNDDRELDQVGQLSVNRLWLRRSIEKRYNIQIWMSTKSLVRDGGFEPPIARLEGAALGL